MVQNFSRYQCFPTVGKIYDKKKKRFVKGHFNKDGYVLVWLQNDDGNWKHMGYHRAILLAYRGEDIPVGYEVNHIDECKTNNCISNLNFMRHNENINHGSRNERVSKSLSKRVQAFDKQGNLVYDFTSVREAERQMGFNIGNISQCCKGKYKTYKGLIWRYYEG